MKKGCGCLIAVVFLLALIGICNAPKREPLRTAPSQTPVVVIPNADNQESQEEPKSESAPPDQNAQNDEDEEEEEVDLKAPTVEATADPPTAGGGEESKRAKQFRGRGKKLYEQLCAFQDSESFRQYGFGVGGPHAKWLDGALKLERDAAKYHDEISPELLEAIYAIRTIGQERASSTKKGPSNYEKEMLLKIKKEFRSEKNLTFPK